MCKKVFFIFIYKKKNLWNFSYSKQVCAVVQSTACARALVQKLKSFWLPSDALLLVPGEAELMCFR